MKKSELKLDCGDLPKEWVASNGLKIVLIEDYATACLVAKALKNSLVNFFINSITKTGASRFHELRRYFYIEREGKITSAFDILYCIENRFKSKHLVGGNNVMLLDMISDTMFAPDDYKKDVGAYREFMLEMNSIQGDFSIGYDEFNVAKFIIDNLED